jgi:hypothetical protein
MSDEIDPAPGVTGERREAERRRGDRRRSQRRKTKPPVVVSAPAVDHDPTAATAFAAQLIGQDGVKRGLKSGPPVLEKARATYLETEWMGPADRRRRPGRSAKTDV